MAYRRRGIRRGVRMSYGRGRRGYGRRRGSAGRRRVRPLRIGYRF